MIKKAIVGTGVGVWMQSQRSRFAVVAAGLSGNPEQAAMLANDVIGETIVERFCQPGEGFLDVGAHIGSVFSRVHRFCPDVRIYAVEADAGKAAALRESFGYCELFECAVGESEGEVTFYRNTKAAGYSSLAAQADSVEVTVALKRLDQLLPEEEIDFIKIDIEGAELGALRGGAGLIERCRPTLFYESVQPGTNSLGYSPEAMWDWLADAGYDIYLPDRLGHDGPAMTRDVYVDSHIFPRRTRNYFALHRDKRTMVRDRTRKILKIAP